SCRADRCLGVERVFHRVLRGLVVLGEGTIDKIRGPKLGDALRNHDESIEGARRRVGLEVWRIADPPHAVPLNARSLGIPRPAAGIGAGAVVKNTAVHGPVPGPILVAAEARWVARVAAGHQVSGLGEAPAVKPVAARGGAVRLELREARKLLTRREVSTVDFLGNLLEGR